MKSERIHPSEFL